MSLSFSAETRDSLSNLAASLNAGRDKTQGDAFFLVGLNRSQAEAMYRGDWLARKIEAASTWRRPRPPSAASPCASWCSGP